MGRSAYSGRNWEGFSPDPYLSGVAMEESILGIQDAGVQATAKHWLLNEQEVLRNPVSYPNGTLQYESISSNVDDRTVRKYFLMTDKRLRSYFDSPQTSSTCGRSPTPCMLTRLLSCVS